MPVVVIPSVMRDATSGRETVEVEGATLKGALSDLTRKYPDLHDRIFDEEGDLQLHLGFFIDGAEARASRGAHAPVGPDSEIVIVPALSGG